MFLTFAYCWEKQCEDLFWKGLRNYGHCSASMKDISFQNADYYSNHNLIILIFWRPRHGELLIIYFCLTCARKAWNQLKINNSLLYTLYLQYMSLKIRKPQRDGVAEIKSQWIQILFTYLLLFYLFWFGTYLLLLTPTTSLNLNTWTMTAELSNLQLHSAAGRLKCLISALEARVYCSV